MQPSETQEVQALSESLGGADAMEREILLNEIESCLNACTEGETQERDCFVFWLYYQQGLSAREIGGISCLDLGVKGVESLIQRTIKEVRERISEGASRSFVLAAEKKKDSGRLSRISEEKQV